MLKLGKSGEKLCSCPVGISTTNKEHFLQPENIKIPILAKLQKPCDIDLISGHIGNNLRFNGQPIQSKTWSEMLPYAENYDDFVKRLKICNPNFDFSSINKKIIERMFKNVNKTAYQLSYSPNIFTPRTEKRRFNKLQNESVGMKCEETTYATYFSRIEEMQRFKVMLQGIQFRPNKEDLNNDLKKIRHCGRTTYHDEMSVLGKLYAKATLPGPIDRYTLRKA